MSNKFPVKDHVNFYTSEASVSSKSTNASQESTGITLRDPINSSSGSDSPHSVNVKQLKNDSTFLLPIIKHSPGEQLLIEIQTSDSLESVELDKSAINSSDEGIGACCELLQEDAKHSSEFSELYQNKTQPVVSAYQNKTQPFVSGSPLASRLQYSQSPQYFSETKTDARSLFIHTEVSVPTVFQRNRQVNLDQFDPLASGQLVLDSYSSASSFRRDRSLVEEEEDNLLKEWNLDFKYKGVPSHGREPPPIITRPPLPPLPPPPQHVDSKLYPSVPVPPFSSMPNIYPVFRALYHPRTVVAGYDVIGRGVGGDVMRPAGSGQRQWASSVSCQPPGTRSSIAVMPMHSSTRVARQQHQSLDVADKSSTLPMKSSLSGGDPFIQNYFTSSMNPNHTDAVDSSAVSKGTRNPRPHSMDVNNLYQQSPWE